MGYVTKIAIGTPPVALISSNAATPTIHAVAKLAITVLMKNLDHANLMTVWYWRKT
jgi:hypothetical protein